ncbi:MAG: TIGR02281 family clan AA aspartic protease [Alphaproteobacteria bacterium]|nr:TIGR02281 family clan AA aspartic protease [Alphaproteobacteria bacterium]
MTDGTDWSSFAEMPVLMAVAGTALVLVLLAAGSVGRMLLLAVVMVGGFAYAFQNREELGEHALDAGRGIGQRIGEEIGDHAANRVRDRLRPTKPREVVVGEVVLEQSANGHFYTEGEINGEPVTFLVDTGASTVAFGVSVAESLGIRRSSLEFDRQGRTAGGIVSAASVILDTVEVGPIEIDDVRATVIGVDTPGLSILLGMSFLSRLEGYEVRDGKFIMRY